MQRAAVISGSGLRLAEDQIGGAVARPHRSLDGCRQPRISPVAGKKQVFPAASTAPGRSAFCSGVASNVARRSRTICQGRQFAANAAGLADVPPDRLRELLARHVHQPVAIADGDRQPLRKREQPFHQPADDAEDRRQRPCGGSKRKCALTMARNLVGVFRPGSSEAAGARRHRQHDGVVRARRAMLSSPKLSSPDPVRRHHELRAAHGRTGRSAPLCLQQFYRGLDQHRSSGRRARSAAGKPGRPQQRFPHDRAGKPRRALRADRR